MFKKMVLIGITVISLTCIKTISPMQAGHMLSFSQQCFNYLVTGFYYVRFGYLAAVDPVMWSSVPSYAMGKGVMMVPENNRLAAYSLGVAGFGAGLGLFYLAYKGAIALYLEKNYDIKITKKRLKKNEDDEFHYYFKKQGEEEE